MDQLLFIPYHKLQIIYLLAAGSAILLFVIFFLRTLIIRGKGGVVLYHESSQSWLWVWLNFLYPNWLDKLTFRQIFNGFAWALASAAVSWIISAVIFLIVIAKVYGP
jgi:hypothetical protein